MENSLLFDILALNRQHAGETILAYLTAVVALVARYFHADITVCYELAPETGGVPRLPPICLADVFLNPERTPQMLNQPFHVGVLSKLIRDWEFMVLNRTAIQKTRRVSDSERDSFEQFLQFEQITSFVFCPLQHGSLKVGAFILAYRTRRLLTDPERKMLELCNALIEMGLAQVSQRMSSAREDGRRRATAHTIFDEIATRFILQVEDLEAEVSDAFEQLDYQLPAGIRSRFQAAKATVFGAMRDLVIEAAGGSVIDLSHMTLYEALNISSATLERAWLDGRPVKIDIDEIPFVIERQSLELRELLYTLVLELIGNSVRHGGPAPYIYVRISWSNNQIYVQVLDHGHGFDPVHVTLSEYGLGFWQTYIGQQLHGTFRITSMPKEGHGTTIIATIPVIPSTREVNAQR